MPDHLFFFAEDPRGAVHAVKMLSVPQVFAVRGTAFQGRTVSESVKRLSKDFVVNFLITKGSRKVKSFLLDELDLRLDGIKV